MKFSFKKVVIWLLAMVVVAVVIVQPGTQSSKYVFQVETISNTCTFDEYQQQDVRTVGDSILIVMPIQTATPCYDAEGTVSFYGNDVTVNLDAVKKGEVCVECVGIVVARVTISNLDSGLYNVQINTPDKSLTYNNMKIR